MNANLRKELLQRMAEEQKLRMELIDRPNDEEIAKRMMEVDQQNTVWLELVIQQHGWPGKSLVGDDGSNAVFLIVQHSPNHVFQKQCLAWLEQAVNQGEAEAKSLAYLTDRVRMTEGKKQIYGTQGQYQPDGKIVPAPIEDEEHVDERRQAIGLESMAAYFRQMNEFYKSKTG